MTKFEYKIITPILSPTEDHSELQKWLNEWGELGFELVNAIPNTNHSGQYILFLKKKLDE